MNTSTLTRHKPLFRWGAALALIGVSVASGATLTWDVGTGDGTVVTDGGGTWQDGQPNWNNAGVDGNWVNGEDAVIGGGTLGAAGTIVLGGGVSVGTITFNVPNGGGSYVLDTSTFGLTLNTGITANQSATIQNGAGGSLILGANAALAVADTKTLAITAPISGTGLGFTKTGLGTLALSAANIFTGALQINEGTVYASANAGALGAGTLVLNGGTLHMANDAALNFGRATTLSGNSTLVVDRLASAATSLTMTQGTLLVSGDVTLNTLRGANITGSGNGQTNFGATTLEGNLMVTQGARSIVQFGAIGESGGPRSLTVGDGVTANGGNSFVFLNGTGGWTGGTVVNSGNVRAIVTNSLGASGSQTTVNGGSLQLSNISAAQGRTIDFAGTGNGTLNLRSNDINTPVTFDIGTLTQTGSGTSTISATRNSGTDGTQTIVLNEDLTLNGNLILTATNPSGSGETTFRFQGVISDGVGINNLTKSGTGIVVLEATSAYDGLTTINNGTLRVGIANALPSGAGKGDFTMNPATTATLDLNGFNQTLNGISSSGAGTSVIDNVGAGVATLTIGANDGAGTFAGTLQDTGGNLSLVKTGAGLITLSGTGTYQGSTSVDGGILLVQPAVLTNTSAVNVGTGANGTLGFVPDGTGSLMTLANNTNLNLGSASTFGGLFFQLGADTASSDRIALQGSGALTVAAGGGLINGLNLGTFTAGDYDLITGSVGITGLGNVLAGNLPGGFTYSFTEPATGTLRMTSTAVGEGDLFWTGDVISSWSTPLANTNWSTTQGSNMEAGFTPGSNTTVNFSAVGAANFSTTLDNNYSVAGINILPGGSAVSIASGLLGTLTVGTGGINVQTGAPALTTISAPVTATGGQSWTIADGGSVLEVNAGVAASANLTKAGAGTLILGPVASTVAGQLDVTGTLRLAGGALAAGSLSGAGTVENGSATTNAVLTIGADNSDTTFSGSLQNGDAATLALTKTGTGALTLSGNHTHTGNTNVLGGTLNVTGTITGNPSSSFLIYGGTSTGNSVVNVSNDMTLFGLRGSNVNGGVGVYNQTAGNVDVTGDGGTATYIAGAAGSYGYFNLTGGTFKARGRFGLGITSNLATPSTSVVYVGGTGRLDQTNGLWMLNYSHAQITVAGGGEIDRTGATNPFGLIMNSTTAGGQYGVLNLAGGSFRSGTQAIRFGNSTAAGAGNDNTAFINLAGGTLEVGTALATSLPSAGANNAYLNFAGGTLKTTAGITNWIPTSPSGITFTSTIYGPIDNSSLTGAPSFDGGLVFDSNGFNSTISTVLGGATANGVAQTSLTVTGGSGYVGAPEVIFSGGTLAAGGSPAAGYALIDGGEVTGIVITSPGSYLDPTGLQVDLNGGGGTGASVGVGSLVTNSTSGGLTKTGAGTLTLTGTNTFTGATVVNGGTLSIAPGALPNTSSLQVGVTGDGAFDLYQDGVGATWTPATNTSITLGSAGFSGALGFDLATPATSDTMTLSGTGVLTVNAGGGIINANALSGFGAGTYNLVTGPNNIVGGANLGLGVLPSGFSYSLDYTTDPKILALVASAAAAGDLYWTGDVDGSWSNFNSGNTNWATVADGSVEAGFTPGSASTVKFSATNAGAAPITTTLDSTVSILGLEVLNSGTGAVTINPGVGGSLTLGVDGIDIVTGAPALTTIAAPVTLGAAQTWTVAGGTALDVSGVLSGSGNLDVEGGGTVNLTGANTFTGNVVVDGTGSTLTYTGSSALNIGDTSAQSYTVSNGGTISLVGAVTSNPTAASNTSFVIGTGGGALNVADAAGILQLDDASQFSGAGNLTKTGDGLLLLGNAFTDYTGTLVTVNGGQLRVQNTQALGTTGSQADISLAAGTTLHTRQNTASSDFESDVTVTGDASLLVNRTSNGAGLAHFFGNLGIGSQTLTVQAGTSVTSGTMTARFDGLTLSGSPIFDVLPGTAGGATQFTILGNVTESSPGLSLTKSGGGLMVIGGASSFTGGIVLNAGTLRGVGQTPTAPFPAAPTVDPFGSNTITLNGGTLQVRDNADGGTTARTLTYDNPIVVTANAAINVDRIDGTGTSHITRFGRVTIDNGATLTMTGANGYDVTFNSTAGNINTLLSSVTINVTAETLNFANAGSTTSATNVSLTDDLGSFGLTKTGAGNLTLGRTTIDGLVQVDAGTLQLNSTGNLLPGGIELNAGTLLANAANGVFGAGSSPDVLVDGGIVDLRVNTAAQTVGFDYRGDATLALRNNSATTFQVESLDIANTATAFTLNVNRASGAGGTATNVFRGPVTTNGDLQFNVTGANGRTASIDNNVASSVTLGGNITFNPTTANLIIDAPISDGSSSFSLTKIGAGTLTLGGANLYEGPTTLTAGALYVNNTAGSGTGTGAVTTAASTILGGNGIIAPNSGNGITTDGTLAIGGLGQIEGEDLGIVLTSGTMGVNEKVSFDLFSGFDSGVLNGATAADRLSFVGSTSGAVALGASSSLVVNSTSTSMVWAEGSAWQLFDWAGIAPVGTFSNLTSTMGNFTDLPDLTDGLMWDVSNVYTTGTILVIPEPGRAALLLVGLAGLVLRRRRA